LVELLVVIGIIALLISILLPSLNRARQSAYNVKCLTNLRSLGQAVIMYANDNKDSLPFGDYSAAASSGQNSRWYLQVQAVLDGKSGTTWSDSYASGSQTSTMRDMFLCPDVPSQSKDTSNTGNVHYVCHPQLMPDTNIWWNLMSPPVKTARPYKLGQVKNASGIALLMDGALIPATSGEGFRMQYDNAVATAVDKMSIWGPTHLNAPYWKPMTDSVDMTPNGGNAADCNKDTPGNIQNIRFRHMNDIGMNAVMVDGHAESFTLDPKKAPNDPQKTTFTRQSLYVNAAPGM